MPNIQEVLLLNGRAIGAFPSSGGGIRYDEENDVIQLYYNGQWVDWKSGGMAYPVGTVITFEYSGIIEPFVVPATGNWKIEAWGAQGGRGKDENNVTNTVGGKGGYTVGTAYFDIDDEYYVCVGGKGSDYSSSAPGGYNGGGNAGGDAGAGGGASHIGKVNQLLKDTSIDNILIVAGGGGGGGGCFTYNGSRYGGNGGAGGGLTGNAGTADASNGDWSTKSGGGSQQACGASGYSSTKTMSGSVSVGGFGYGSSSPIGSGHKSGGGGGGFYGGGGAPSITNAGGCGGGGGSSYYDTSILTDYSTTAGQRENNGLIKFTYLGR